MKVFIAGQL